MANLYVRVPPEGSPFKRIFRVFRGELLLLSLHFWRLIALLGSHPSHPKLVPLWLPICCNLPPPPTHRAAAFTKRHLPLPSDPHELYEPQAGVDDGHGVPFKMAHTQRMRYVCAAVCAATQCPADMLFMYLRAGNLMSMETN